ncbi:Clavaminate synthase-like protein [Coniophora puteana RWD-64-598 SS2]|uniref:Clavaminate synthase-like protein n=1 Tax=Coniophora puteana (strain RWD-64-598) TaxID=741705 RepID=A0A5M3N700_CONPW|nr:Clavaminate synthase-like protein [Coniophora puteana RWD-64-598 SS2]EIW87212.1 Clavaminate synthase-like protein [Coniophora puteana RWD-64-598 SS2]
MGILSYATKPNFVPITLPPSVDAAMLQDFGRIVEGINPATFSEGEFMALSKALHEHGFLVFRDVTLSPGEIHRLVKAFDPEAESYGHGSKRNSRDRSRKSPFAQIQNVPSVPQVQLIGHGTVRNHEGIDEATLSHPSHRTFHQTPLSMDDEEAGYTRFYHWHMDAALYSFKPPKVTALYAVQVPNGPSQTVRYDDGTGDELPVPLGTTAFTSGRISFEILPRHLQSVAVRSRVKYAPHPFLWMNPAGAMSNGLGLETEGRETPLDQLPPWDESKRQTLPMLWKNPVTGGLHLQVAATAVTDIFIDPLPINAEREDALYPDGAHLTDLKELRELLYQLQRPGISPSLVYPHDWKEKDLVLFHNRGVNHSVVGSLNDDHIRVFHQCNLAATDLPLGPDEEDTRRWA